MSSQSSDPGLRPYAESLLSGPSLPGRLETERARILSTILTAGALVSGVMTICSPLWSADPGPNSIGYGLTFLLHVFHLWLAHRGYARLAAKSFSILFFALVTVMVYAFGGVRGLGGFVYPLAALFAGLTWSAWAAVGVAVAASMTSLLMALAETRGFMTSVAPAPSAGAAWAIVTASVTMTAVMLFAALRIIRASTLEAVESERQRRVLEKELAQARRMEALGQLAGGVAHDFNNLLTGIIGHAELIALKCPPSSDVGEHAELILTAGEKAAQISRELLTFSRKRGRILEDVHVNEIIRNVIGILEPSVDEAIRVRTELGADPDLVHGDSAQIEMALLNLALNARDALSEGGTLAFRTSRTDPAVNDDGGDEPPWIRIDVSDTGTGMTDALRERIFEPYFSTKTAGRGTGLGLSAVYGTVQHHGGHLEVVSEVNLGTTVTIRLPAAAAPLQRFEPPAPPEDTSHPLTILAIDDDRAVLELLRGFLEQLGHSIRTAATGEEGLALYNASPFEFDLVIVDLVMPGISGREVLETLRRRNDRLPVIVTSGAVAEVEDVPGGSERVKFLPKPYRRADLSHLISGITAQRIDTAHRKPPR